MSLAGVTRTRWTVWPLMSIPRMASALSPASPGVSANFTPPALPRPPVFTWALTTTGVPSRSAAARASAAVDATTPGSTGTPWAAKSSLAWYSNRSTQVLRWLGCAQSRSRASLRRACASVRTDPFDDRLRGGTGGEHGGDAELLQLGDVPVGDDPAAEDGDVAGVLSLQQLDDLGEQRHVRAGQHAQPDRVRVLLDGGGHDLLGGLVEPGVDDLDAGVAQRSGDDLGASVMPVQPGLGDDHTDGVHAGQVIPGQCGSAPYARLGTIRSTSRSSATIARR